MLKARVYLRALNHSSEQIGTLKPKCGLDGIPEPLHHKSWAVVIRYSLSCRRHLLEKLLPPCFFSMSTRWSASSSRFKSEIFILKITSKLPLASPIKEVWIFNFEFVKSLIFIVHFYWNISALIQLDNFSRHHIWVRFPRTGILAKMWPFFEKSRAFV